MIWFVHKMSNTSYLFSAWLDTLIWRWIEPVLLKSFYLLNWGFKIYIYGYYLFNKDISLHLISCRKFSSLLLFRDIRNFAPTSSKSNLFNSINETFYYIITKTDWERRMRKKKKTSLIIRHPLGEYIYRITHAWLWCVFSIYFIFIIMDVIRFGMFKSRLCTQPDETHSARNSQNSFLHLLLLQKKKSLFSTFWITFKKKTFFFPRILLDRKMSVFSN